MGEILWGTRRPQNEYLIQFREACHGLLHLPQIFTPAAAFFRPLCIRSLALKLHSNREHDDGHVSFQRFWTKLISLRERSRWVRRTEVEFLKSHISKYIWFSMEIQKRHCHRNPAAPEFLLKVLCILKYVILEIPPKFSALNLIVLEGKSILFKTVEMGDARQCPPASCTMTLP